VAAALDQGQAGTDPVPEIALTHAFWNASSGALAPSRANGIPICRKDARKVWRQVAEGGVRVVAGVARRVPAVQGARLIVVDEDTTLPTSRKTGLLQARDMAVVRGHIGSFPVVLASGDTIGREPVNASQGKYNRAVLSARFAEAALRS